MSMLFATRDKPRTLRSYTCYLAFLSPSEGSTFVARSAGHAKAQYFYQLRDPCPDARYTDIRCLSHRLLLTSPDFARCAEYRGVSFAHVGMRVRVGESLGTIVGHNASSNFDVLFDDDDRRYPGSILNCHPNSGITYFDAEGEPIRSYT